MMSRRAWAALALLGAGIALMVVSYLALAAPWGFPPETEEFSNPRLDFAPLLFILGVIAAFSAAILYELWPERRGKG